MGGYQLFHQFAVQRPGSYGDYKTVLPLPSYSATRWWSHFEVFDQFLSTFCDVPTFLENEDLAPSNSSKLREILSHPAKCRKLKMKLAVTVDAMEPFVKATYYLGDGVLAFLHINV